MRFGSLTLTGKAQTSIPTLIQWWRPLFTPKPLFCRISLEFNKTTNVNLCSANCTGIADSSNNAIVGPKDAILGLNAMIQARKIPFFGRFYVDCDTVMKLPKITFVLQGQPFTLNGKQYTQKVVCCDCFCLLLFLLFLICCRWRMVALRFAFQRLLIRTILPNSMLGFWERRSWRRITVSMILRIRGSVLLEPQDNKMFIVCHFFFYILLCIR